MVLWTLLISERWSGKICSRSSKLFMFRMGWRKIKAFIIFFDEETNASSVKEFHSLNIEEDDIKYVFGGYLEKENPRKFKDINLTISAMNHQGKANICQYTLYRDEDLLTGKWLETKKEFKEREFNFYTKLIKKRHRR